MNHQHSTITNQQPARTHFVRLGRQQHYSIDAASDTRAHYAVQLIKLYLGVPCSHSTVVRRALQLYADHLPMALRDPRKRQEERMKLFEVAAGDTRRIVTEELEERISEVWIFNNEEARPEVPAIGHLFAEQARQQLRDLIKPKRKESNCAD